MKNAKDKGVIPDALCQHIVDICEKYIKREEEKTMELKINAVALPEAISFNYEELKAELVERTAKYETMVYGEEQIKEAKEDRANLNKLKKALNDERIRQEKEYMKPFNVFKAQINEIISIIDKPILMIDGQVKEFEEIKKKEKAEMIELIFDSTEHPEWLTLGQIFNQKWLNASVNQKTITEEIDTKIDAIKKDLATLQILPDFSFEATEIYKTTLDINKALEEGKRLAEIQKKKAEEIEKMKVAAMMPTPDAEALNNMAEAATENVPEKEWISFKALLSTEDARALSEFFKSKNIQYKAI